MNDDIDVTLSILLTPDIANQSFKIFEDTSRSDEEVD